MPPEPEPEPEFFTFDWIMREEPPNLHARTKYTGYAE
jgi:hypothetical protein